MTPRASPATIETSEGQQIQPKTNQEDVKNRFWLVRDRGKSTGEWGVELEDG